MTGKPYTAYFEVNICGQSETGEEGYDLCTNIEMHLVVLIELTSLHIERGQECK